jgi:hypothetical protein
VDILTGNDLTLGDDEDDETNTRGLQKEKGVGQGRSGTIVPSPDAAHTAESDQAGCTKPIAKPRRQRVKSKPIAIDDDQDVLPPLAQERGQVSDIETASVSSGVFIDYFFFSSTTLSDML